MHRYIYIELLKNDQTEEYPLWFLSIGKSFLCSEAESKATEPCLKLKAEVLCDTSLYFIVLLILSLFILISVNISSGWLTLNPLNVAHLNSFLNVILIVFWLIDMRIYSSEILFLQRVWRVQKHQNFKVYFLIYCWLPQM